MKELEKHIQRAIMEYLSYKRYFYWRNNTGAMKTAHGGFYHFGLVGSPDIILVHDGTVFFLEVKRKGSRQTLAQKSFQMKAERAGAIYAVVYSVDDVQALGL